ISRPFHVTTNAAVNPSADWNAAFTAALSFSASISVGSGSCGQHVPHGPQWGRGIGQSALDVDRLEIHGALADWERDATLAPEILGGTGHAIREHDVDRPVGAIDDRLAEFRALSVGRREKPDIFRREIGRKAGHEYS